MIQCFLTISTFLTICPGLLPSVSVAQTKQISGILSSKGDTTYGYKYIAGKAAKLALHTLDTCQDAAHYRIWTNRYAIDLTRNDSGSLSCRLVTWTNEHTPDDETPTNRIFVKVRNFNADTSELIRRLILSSGILNLPTDDSIKGWRWGSDGITYIIEYSTKDYYSFKHYWTPEIQGSLKEARLVQSLIDRLCSLAETDRAWSVLTSQVPYECYTNGWVIACRIGTKKQKRIYRRERKHYLRTIAKNDIQH